MSPVFLIFIFRLIGGLEVKSGQKRGSDCYIVGFYWTEQGHQSYKHEEADSDEANTRGSPHFAADALPTARFPKKKKKKSSFQSRVPQK